MKSIPFLFLALMMTGCNYSLDKTPLQVREDNTGLTALTYPVIHTTIMQPKCISCHSNGSGNSGDINLENYANVAGNLDIIMSEVLSDRMPKNRAKLSAADKALLVKWIEAGAPENVNDILPPIKHKHDPTPPPAPTPVPEPTLPVTPPPPSPIPEVEFISYEMVHVNVIQPRCLNCHSDASGNRGNVNLETYENVAALSSAIEEEIKSGSMPRPRNKPLTLEQKEMILKWIANGSPKTKE